MSPQFVLYDFIVGCLLEWNSLLRRFITQECLYLFALGVFSLYINLHAGAEPWKLLYWWRDNRLTLHLLCRLGNIVLRLLLLDQVQHCCGGLRVISRQLRQLYILIREITEPTVVLLHPFAVDISSHSLFILLLFTGGCDAAIKLNLSAQSPPSPNYL